MKQITISEGITLTATQSTIDTFLREQREAQREREAREWLDSHDSSDELYSDIFKDVYGFRPRW